MLQPAGGKQPDARVIAVDLGGTLMKGAIATTGGRPLHQERASTNGVDPSASAVIGRLLDFTRLLVERCRQGGVEPSGIGVVVPGIVDETRGVAVASSNIGWRSVPLRDAIEREFSLPAAIGHDVRAGASAEAACGAGRSADNFVFIPIGTGIGAAAVIRGAVFPGDNFAATELGHLVVWPDGDRCTCGRIGCLETIASAAAIMRRFRARTGRVVASAADVLAAADEGDAVAAAIWADAVSGLAKAIEISHLLLDIDLHVLGGGLAKAGEALLTPLRAALSTMSFEGSTPTIVPAQLGDEAGCVGAALLISRHLTEARKTL
jgi:glucokinase